MMKIFKNKLRFLAGVVVMFTFSLNVLAQRTAYFIKGKVSDATGGIPGAILKIDGNSFGTITHAEGDYTLNANLAARNYKLSVSSVVYATFRSLSFGKSSKHYTRHYRIKMML